jgi:type IV secretory pathway VirB2 component (pilin)
MGEESPQTEVPDWSAAASAVLSEPTQALPTVLPSEPDIPAAEAEVALGGVPSPATSPIDAASIAAAAEVASEPAGPADPAADDRHDEADDESDGLALLFGDVAPIDHEADEEPASGSSETGDETDGGESPTSGDDLFRASEEEPAAALEGPQLTPTVPFVFPPESPIDTDEADGIDDPSDSVTAEAPVVDAPQDAGSAWPPVAGAGAAADGSAVTAGSAAPDAAGSSASSTPVTAATSPSAAAAPAAPGLWDTRNNRILFSVAGGLAIVLVLIGLFALGTRIPSLFGAAKPAPAPTASATPVASPTPTPTPVPTVTPKPGAAVGAGTHPWDALGGGECIQPFTSVWAQEFTVVDCAAPHTAQLVYTNVLSADPAAPYPGADALAGQIPGLCTASGVVDLGAAGAYPDLQVIGSFPATEQQWKDGQRSYYCFVDRSGGEPLTSSVAGPGPTG